MKRFWLISLLLLLSCSSTKNAGIEAGNPDLKGKTLRIYCTEDNEAYVALFGNDQSVSLENFSVSTETSVSLESVATTYVLDGLNVTITGSFASGKEVVIAFTSDEDGAIASGTSMSVNGTAKTVIGDIEVPFSLAPSSESDAAYELTLSLCSRVSDCFEQTFTDDCKTALMDLNGLPEKFGGPDDSTMQELSDLIVSETYYADMVKKESCLEDISELACSDILDVYTPSADSPDFTGLGSTVPTGEGSCPNVF